MRLAELAPILSQEAHTVNQLTKNIHSPVLNVDQLKEAIDSLSQVVGAFSMQSDSSDGGWISILGAVQRLVEELTVLLSSLDQGNTTQLPQQLSTVSELLSQLVSADREALLQDTNTLRDTITTLQAQLQQLQVCEHTHVILP
jgi:cell division septum initiation protein DivIVA